MPPYFSYAPNLACIPPSAPFVYPPSVASSKVLPPIVEVEKEKTLEKKTGKSLSSADMNDDEQDAEESESESDDDVSLNDNDEDATALLALRKDSSAFSAASSNSSVEERMSNGSMDSRKRKGEEDSDSNGVSQKKKHKKSRSSESASPSVKNLNAKSPPGPADDSEDKPFRCDKCHKRFRRRTNLQVHERVHSDDRPFPCEFENCGKSFKRKHGLKAHIRTHTGYKPFECDHCGRKFSDSGNYKRHAKSQHQVKVEIGRGPRKPDPQMVGSGSPASSASRSRRTPSTTPRKVEKRSKKVASSPAPSSAVDSLLLPFVIGTVPFQAQGDLARAFHAEKELDSFADEFGAVCPVPVVNAVYAVPTQADTAVMEDAVAPEAEHDDGDTRCQKSSDHMLRGGLDPANIVAASVDAAPAVHPEFASAAVALASAVDSVVVPLIPPTTTDVFSASFRPVGVHSTVVPHDEHVLYDAYPPMNAMPAQFAAGPLGYPVVSYPPTIGYVLSTDLMCITDDGTMIQCAAPVPPLSYPGPHSLMPRETATTAAIVRTEQKTEVGSAKGERRSTRRSKKSAPCDGNDKPSNGSSRNDGGGSAGGGNSRSRAAGGNGVSSSGSSSGPRSGSGSGGGDRNGGGGGSNRSGHAVDEQPSDGSLPVEEDKSLEQTVKSETVGVDEGVDQGREELKEMVKSELDTSAMEEVDTDPHAVKANETFFLVKSEPDDNESEEETDESIPVIPSNVVDEGECAVCFDGDSLEDNPIVFCEKVRFAFFHTRSVM